MKKCCKGSLSGAILALILSTTTALAGTHCPPFFDFDKTKVTTNVVQPGGAFLQEKVDITPEPMPRNAFSEAVLSACGEFGSNVDPRAVRRLVQIFNPDLVKALAREFPEYNDSQLREKIFQAWTGSYGFEHVFCGDPKIDKVGGLHYAGRYLELQEKGRLCRLEGNVQNEQILPKKVYTIGITTADGVIDRKKGYSILQSAEDIFFEGARTYLRNCQMPSNERRVCLSRFYKDGSFSSLFVCTPNRGIVTMYPLASTEGQRNPACR